MRTVTPANGGWKMMCGAASGNSGDMVISVSYELAWMVIMFVGGAPVADW
jgi:hypothetical protein